MPGLLYIALVENRYMGGQNESSLNAEKAKGRKQNKPL
jgi:hypothetical protein